MPGLGDLSVDQLGPVIVPRDVDQSVGEESRRVEAQRDAWPELPVVWSLAVTFDLGVMPATTTGLAAVGVGVFSGVAIKSVTEVREYLSTRDSSLKFL